MLSKFKFVENITNYKLFYLTIDEYCCYNQEKINEIRNHILFWDKWLGKNTFDFDFLKETFNDCNNKILLAFYKNDNHYYNIKFNLEGIIIFNKFEKLFYNLILISKRNNSKLSWVGKRLLKKLTNLLSYNLDFIDYFVLTDVSEIPNYYSKLGFIKTEIEYVKKLLDNYEDDIYIKKFNT